MKKTTTNTPHSSKALDSLAPAIDRNAWRWGFTPQAEVWNGRLAMLGFMAAIAFEIFTGQLKIPF
jgi:hypothetical protein